jgi:hypothetical protein
VSTNNYLAYTYTDDTGFYRINNVVPGNDGIRVVAYSPSSYNLTVEGTGTIANYRRHGDR